MSTQKNLMTLCFATVFTLGLAACGGGGGGDAPVAGMMDDDDMTSSLVGKILPTDTTFTLPEGLVDDTTFTVPQGASVPVPGVGTFECVTGPCTVDVASNVVTTTGVIEVVSLAEGLPAEVLTALASITEDAPAGPTPVEMAAAATKAAGTKAKAIGKVMVATVFDAVDVTVTNKRSGPEIKVEGDDEFTRVMGPMYRLEHAADDDGNVVEEIVLVDHTITAPKGMGFAKVHDLDARDLDEEVNADGIGNAMDDFTAVNVVMAKWALVMSDDFVAGAGTTTLLTFDADVASTSTVNESSKVAGTYDGAPGTYQCTGDTDCSVTLFRNAKGVVSISNMDTSWIFIPDDGARVYVLDPVYTSYGVWLQRTTDADGVLTYDKVDTYAMGHGGTASDVANVTGTASYTGSALGVYVHNVLDSGGEIASATGGSFTADATLTASFDQSVDDAATTGVDEADLIAPAHLNTITGTIDNFELAGGEAQSWSVELSRGDMGAINDAGTFDGKTKCGGAEGDYNGTFYGPTTDGAPSDVSGEFTANFLNGHVAGGFGATKQDD